MYGTGVFLKGMTVLLPVGIYHAVRNKRSVFTMLVLAVFLCAPLAASLVNERYTIGRALVLVPTGALIGSFGIDWLLERRRRAVSHLAGRAMCAGPSIWMAHSVQGLLSRLPDRLSEPFGVLVQREPSGSVRADCADDPPGDGKIIYLSESLPWILQHWKLYLLSTGRMDLLPLTVVSSRWSISISAAFGPAAFC